MSKEITVWCKVMTTALSMPGVKVDRESFLRREFALFCAKEQVDSIVDSCPGKVASKDVIDRIAKSCINSHATKVTLISAATGLPGGLAMWLSVPADVAQYYFHVFVVSQKLAYLYGYPDLCDENGHLNDSAIDILTLFVGLMMGVSVANHGITLLAKNFAEEVVTRLPKKALTKTAIYPIVKQIAGWLGVKLTKKSFAKQLGKLIPIAGGVISGGITFALFKPGANRLKKRLQEDMDLLAARFDNAETQ